MKKEQCDLCGLPLKYGAVLAQIRGESLSFCCLGCRQVYEMLVEASADEDLSPDHFRQTDIFKRCVTAGIIPASIEELSAQGPATDGPKGSASDTASTALDDYPLKLALTISGMWCPACAWTIEETLNRTDGIHQARCQFLTDRLILSYDPVSMSPHRIQETIEKLGYHALQPEDTAFKRESRREFIRLGICAFLSLNVMMLSFALYSGFFTPLSPAAIYHITWPIVVMTAIVYIYGGASIHRKTVYGLRSAAFGMETLVWIGASSAFFYSIFNWYLGSIHLYCDTTCMLITIVLIGTAIEQRAKNHVYHQINDFFELVPAKARICTDQFPSGKYADISQLSTGDIFAVQTDEIIPADGTIVSGQALVDESSLTGEPKPVMKHFKDRVTSGTKVISGSLTAKAVAVGEASMINQLVAVLEQALEGKTVLEGVTDRALKWFVPLIVLLAVGTFGTCLFLGLGDRVAMIRAVTVLVISCPCALGIAIPLARVAGISLSSQKGILVHHFSAFETIQKLSAIVFDKTGTLTQGQWNLIDVMPLDRYPIETIWKLATGLEQQATHYAGQAIVAAGQKKGIIPAPLDTINEVENGISGYIDNQLVKIGSALFLSDEIAHAEASLTANRASIRKSYSQIYMAVDGTLCALFQFGDSIRASVPQMIQSFTNQGLRLAVISGDGRETTQRLGTRIGIDDCRGAMRPTDKARFIQALKEKNHVVAMVGDGVNDVPALATADLGIAINSGYQIGQVASGITLMQNDPQQILLFEKIANTVLTTIRQNLMFTFLYNIISIPVAMSGLLNPLIAVTAMLMSSLSVTGNTLLLERRFRKQQMASVEK